MVWKDIRRLLGVQLGFDARRVQTDTNIDSVFLRRYLEGMGVDYTLSADKRVPDPILRATERSVREFLRGLFEGDGGAVSTGGIEYSTASEQLAREVQILLLKFGIVAKRSTKIATGHAHTYWRLTIFGNDARQFQKVIGFISPRKQERLQGILPDLSNPNHDVIPFAKELVENLRAEIYEKAGLHGHSGEGISTRWGSGFYTTMGHIRQGTRNPTYAYLEKMLEVAAEVDVPSDHPSVVAVRNVCQQKFFYDPIEKVTEGFKEVFDIEVDDPAHSFVGNGLINHNTLETIAALCHIWEKDPTQKVVVLTTKSGTTQWVREFSKFTRNVRVIGCRGTPTQRMKAIDYWEKSTGPCVVVMGYRSAVRDISRIQGLTDYIVVFDEATAFKNPRTQVHQVCKFMAASAKRAWGLTATLIKNHLMEGYGIYQVVMPGLFGMNHNKFMMYYCVVRMQQIPRSNRHVPVIIGYTPERIQEFKDVIDPYFLGRPKHEVASELPVLIPQVVEIPLTDEQQGKYDEALAGLLEKGTGEVTEVTKLTAITYCQQICNDLELLGIETESPKLTQLTDMLTEGDLAEENVIVFSRFRKMIDIIMPTLKTKKVEAVRITGSENEAQRQDAMATFQNPESGTRVCCITAAGSEAINLQAAKAVICVDTPWSAGDFLQLVGRMIRIGSLHDRCYVIHLVAKGRSKTVDHRVMEVLRKKMKLVEAVLGKRIKGEDDDTIIAAENEISDLFHALREDAKDQ